MVAKKAIKNIIEELKEGPLSISEVARRININWRTAEQYLELLESIGVLIKREIKNTKTYYLKQEDNYFHLPVKKEDEKKINAIYCEIKKHCQKKYGIEPTKTQAYKILWKVNKILNLNLPIGWYQYGPCCVQVYKGNERGKFKEKLVKEITEEYCAYDNFKLQKKVYENNQLYQLKDSFDQPNSSQLMDLIKLVPKEATETVTDFSRATLMLGWEKTKLIFYDLWKFISLIIYRDSLRDYYGDAVDVYLNINDIEHEVKVKINDLVRTHTDSKHSQEELYQRYVGTQKNP